MDSPVPSVCPLLPTPTPPLIPPSSSSPGCGSGSASSEQPGSGPPVSGAAGTPASSSPSNPETEEDKAKKLLYCSLCKVAVNSLSQLEAHNKGGLICELGYAEIAVVLLHFPAISWQSKHVTSFSLDVLLMKYEFLEKELSPSSFQLWLDSFLFTQTTLLLLLLLETKCVRGISEEFCQERHM